MSDFLHFTLELRAPLVVAMPSSDPNKVQSMPYLPGSVVRGAFASLLRGQTRFEELVLSGAVRYLPAYPAPSTGIRAGQRTIPTPATWWRERGTDSAMWDVLDGKVELADLERSPWAFVEPELLQAASCELETQFHNSRDRKAGRATAITGAVFTYEAIRAGTVLSGVVCVSGSKAERAERLEALKVAAARGLRFGRSQHVQYGGNPVVVWASNPQPRELARTSNGLLRHLVTDGVSPGSEFAALLTSDALARDRVTGMVDPSAAGAELCAQLNDKVEVIETVGVTGLAGGYNSHWRLALPVGCVVRGGAVIRLRAREAIAQVELEAVEGAGIGERRAEGFGAVVFLSGLSPTGASFALGNKPATMAPVPRPSSEMPKTVRALQERMMLSATLGAVESTVARLAKGARSIPARSLLGRLRVPLQTGAAGLEELRTWLGSGKGALRPRAMKQLERCELTPELFKGSADESDAPERRFLDEWLRAMMRDAISPKMSVTWKIMKNDGLRRFALDDDPDALQLLAASLDVRVRVRFIDRLLQVLARKTQREAKR